jgi:hypothetical protein
LVRDNEGLVTSIRGRRIISIDGCLLYTIRAYVRMHMHACMCLRRSGVAALVSPRNTRHTVTCCTCMRGHICDHAHTYTYVPCHVSTLCAAHVNVTTCMHGTHTQHVTGAEPVQFYSDRRRLYMHGGFMETSFNPSTRS